MLEAHNFRSGQAYPESYPENKYAHPIADIKRFGKQYWSTIALAVLVSMLAALFYVLNATPVFTATARLLLEPKTQYVFNVSTKENMITLDTPHVESQLAILKSTKIAAIVVERFREQLESDAGNLGIQAMLYSRIQDWLSTIGIQDWLLTIDSAELDPDEVNTNNYNRLLTRTLEKIDPQRVGLSFAIDISYQSGDPVLAANVANAVVDAYISDQSAVLAANVQKRAAWLGQRIADLRKEMNATAQNLKELKAKRDYRIHSRRDGDASADGAKKHSELEKPAWEGGSNATVEELELRNDTYRRIYEGYLSAYLQTVSKGSPGNSAARAITRATAPIKRSHPRTFLILAFALAVGLFTGLGIALIRNNL